MAVVRQRDVTEAFDALIQGTRSREEVSDWARSLRLANDQGALRFDPPEAGERIWNAITYLEGVDLKDGPSSYLHVVEDLAQFRRSLRF